MRVLDALLPNTAPAERRSSFDAWVQDWFSYGGHQYGLGQNPITTYGKNPAEPISANFSGYVSSGLQGNAIVAAVQAKRVEVFSQARPMYQELIKGRPGKLWSDESLEILRTPWTGGTTGDLLARDLLYADYAGNAYTARIGGELVQLRPDWVEIILEARMVPYAMDGGDIHLGHKRAGYFYYEGGKYSGVDPAVFLPDEVCHFAPKPDPLACYRGMSWLTPVLREIQTDGQATKHKEKFFENGATANLVVKAPEGMTEEQFKKFVAANDAAHRGVDNAYKTYYLAGGSDVTVVGADMRQMDFSNVQGKGETRIANAAGVPAVVVGLSEGMQGSSLNAGNYNSAKRNFADTTCEYLWQQWAGSMQVIVSPPSGSRMWLDKRFIPFLRDDEKDLAEIQAKRAQTIRTLVDAGFEPGSVITAVESEDFTRLVHSGLYSVQLQLPGTQPAITAA